MTFATVDDVIAGVEDDASRAFVRHWFDIRRGRTVPDRRDIDPAALAALLPKLWLWEYAPEQDDFVCRLAGEEICAVFGRNPRGVPMRDWVPKPVADVARPRYRRVIDEPAICVAKGNSYISGNKQARCERVVTPMTNGGTTRSVLFGLTVWQLPDYLPGDRFEREESAARFYALGVGEGASN